MRRGQKCSSWGVVGRGMDKICEVRSACTHDLLLVERTAHSLMFLISGNGAWWKGLRSIASCNITRISQKGAGGLPPTFKLFLAELFRIPSLTSEQDFKTQIQACVEHGGKMKFHHGNMAS